MNPVMQSLRELGELDRQLRSIALRRSEKQKRIEDAQQALAETEAQCTSKRDEAKALQREADALTLDMKTAEGAAAKLEDQQRQAKSNKEYDVFKREIEAAKQKSSELEDGILERLERIDTLHAEEKASQARVTEAQKVLQAARDDAASAEKEIVHEESAFLARRAAVVGTLEPELRHHYERLLEQRKDTAVARVSNGVCSMCSRKISRQMEAMLDIGQEIVYCMSCSRILYVDEAATGS